MNIDSTQLTSALSELQSLLSTYSTDSTTTTQSSSVPEAGSALSVLLSSDSLPTLATPTGSILSLDTLLQALGDDIRRQACQDGVESLELKAEQQKEVNEKELQEIADRLEEMKKKSVLDGFLKAFKIIGVIVGAIASIGSVVAGALTANPLLITAGVVGMVMTTDSIVSLASDGKYSIAAGFTELGKQMSMSDDTAQWFGFAMNIAIMIASIAVTMGAGLASSTGSTTAAAAQTAEKAAEVASTTSKVANVASGVVTTGEGATTIASAVVDYNINTSYATSKELEAILERIRESIQIDEDLIEAEMERANTLMEQVRDIVEDCTSTQAAILGATPEIA